jgi:peptidoglycan hydrolase-like protein with peptidoglycan-binding domain
MLTSRRLGSDAQLQKATEKGPQLSRGSKGSGVGILQDLLADLGFTLKKSLARGMADADFGPETEAAVKAYQSSRGLKADGIVGPKTLHALDEEVRSNRRLETRDGATDLHAAYW